mgnify:CR=1 FL=1
MLGPGGGGLQPLIVKHSCVPNNEIQIRVCISNHLVRDMVKKKHLRFIPSPLSLSLSPSPSLSLSEALLKQIQTTNPIGDQLDES